MKGIEVNNGHTATSRKQGSPALETIKNINLWKATRFCAGIICTCLNWRKCRLFVEQNCLLPKWNNGREIYFIWTLLRLVLDNIWGPQENFTDRDEGGTKTGHKRGRCRLYLPHSLSQNVRLSTRLAALYIL
jgi:hypothetical protein